MKIAVSSNGKDLDSQIDPRFGRCQYFIIVELDDMSFETYKNENVALTSSAGIQSASFVASHNVKALLTGNCGPKAAQVFSSTNIEVITGVSGTIHDAIEKFKNGNLHAGINENSPENFIQENSQQMYGGNAGMQGGGMGMRGGGRCMGGKGSGMGGGRGGGMGMGGGRGGGMGMGGGNRMSSGNNIPLSKQVNSVDASKDNELQMLKMEEANLQSQIRDIKSRMKDLE
jgi:predicted Fe-Mo cluster-binding NifX family protein